MIQVPLTPEEFQTKANQLAEQQGIAITGHEGTIEKMGVKASYLYADGVLTINILHKPMFLSEDMCEKQLRAWL
jgi:NAD/NADP transhydrogenase alpha subunit